MSATKVITWDDFMEETHEVVHEDIGTWRHGSTHTVVLKDEEGRYWEAYYRSNPSGDHNEWRDDEPDKTCPEVFPHTVTTVVYKKEPQQS